MGKYKYLMIHCSATPEGRDLDGEDIKLMHTAPKPRGRGWKRAGYSKVIKLDGEVDVLHDYNEDSWIDANEITNGARGYNSVTRHFCYIGGCDSKMKPKDTRTDAQIATLKRLIREEIENNPDVKVLGHNQVASKACPSFDVSEWLRSNCFAESNIF